MESGMTREQAIGRLMLKHFPDSVCDDDEIQAKRQAEIEQAPPVQAAGCVEANGVLQGDAY